MFSQHGWLLGAVASVVTAQTATVNNVTTCGNYTGTAASPVVSVVDYGCVQGNKSSYVDSVYNFKNINYASSPAGEYRWHHPQHPTAWTELRDATAFGPACPQSGVDYYDEDCLTLNIWTPTNQSLNDYYTGDFIGVKPNANASALPVFVWIYGGRFGGGAASDPLYDGAGLAAKGVVVVTLNYRLGALGWLAHPDISALSTSGTSGNYGLVDQEACLHWVNERIAAFGGDPARITIGGQSAGAASVLDHLSTTLASGLFEQVIAESGARYPSDPMIGSLAQSYRNLSVAEAQGVDYVANVLNVSSVDAARNLSVEYFLSSAQLSDDTAYAGTVFENNSIYMAPPLFRPVLDGYVLPATYQEDLVTGNHSLVPILTGNNKDESGASPAPGFTVATYTETAGEIAASVGLEAEYFALYPAGNTSATANNASNAFYRDQSRVGTKLWADEYAAGCAAAAGGGGNASTACAVYTYYWTHAPPGQDRGAYHMSEINYAFNNLYATDLPWAAEDYAIADTVSGYWVNFIAGGSPNGAGLAEWPAAAEAGNQTMELGEAFGVVGVAAGEENVGFLREWFGKWPVY